MLGKYNISISHALWILMVFLTCACGRKNTYIHLPLEVIGPNGYEDSLQFDLSNDHKAHRIYLRINNLSYDGKCEIQLNDYDWMPLVNDSCYVHMPSPDGNYGGIGGGFSTLRLEIDLPNEWFHVGQNILRFKFNYGIEPSTEMVISAGYRLIEFNIKDINNKNLLSDDVFTYEDPSNWAAPFSDKEAIAKGKMLWDQAMLKNANGDPINAKCGWCHAKDGRDLKYFNYSNKSIVERAKFHHLSKEQGELIASYIRTLPFEAPKQARPWNPPYQPGPGTDDKPVFEWAAGAGLEGVLVEDKDMIEQMFGTHSPDRATIDSVMNIRSTLNLRNMGVAVQFPDWKHWLPRIHPADMWKNSWDSAPPNLAYYKIVSAFERDSLLHEKDSLIYWVNRLPLDLKQWVWRTKRESRRDQQHPWTVFNSDPYREITSEYLTPERIKYNLALWQAVKLWEIIHTHNLEDKTARFREHAEVYQWPNQSFSVFQIAAHFIGDRRFTSSFKWEYDDNTHEGNQTVGTYWSSVWYELQMVLNSGMRLGDCVEPVDWAYNHQHVNLLSYRSGVYEPARLFRNIIKNWQERERGPDVPITLHTWTMREVSPWRIFCNHNGRQGVHLALNDYDDGLYGRVVSSMLLSWVNKSNEDHPDPDEWPRAAPVYYTWPELEHQNFDPTGKENPLERRLVSYIAPTGAVDAIEAIALYKILNDSIKFGNIGLEEESKFALQSWCAKQWTHPNTNWYK